MPVAVAGRAQPRTAARLAGGVAVARRIARGAAVVGVIGAVAARASAVGASAAARRGRAAVVLLVELVEAPGREADGVPRIVVDRLRAVPRKVEALAVLRLADVARRHHHRKTAHADRLRPVFRSQSIPLEREPLVARPRAEEQMRCITQHHGGHRIALVVIHEADGHQTAVLPAEIELFPAGKGLRRRRRNGGHPKEQQKSNPFHIHSLISCFLMFHGAAEGAPAAARPVVSACAPRARWLGSTAG